ISKVSPFKLWNSPNDTLISALEYKNLTDGDIYFSQNLGIIKFITNDKLDTFMIIKYHLQ
ncbi:MAG TPA: hypothetical protein VHD33_07205, partial [Legionellaceae bacterium]|nr:hypothetical protein [Legionellaceae bacterium]